jgi:multidrug efflux pump subunit AcrA (membrane-fusion protein)
MPTNTPRIRTDLQATPAEEQGIKYFDVSDPRSGARMRMYDFEWLIASRMDGTRPFDDVAAWARERLGVAPTPSDLESYAHKLRELGFFELDAAGDSPLRAGPTASTMMGVPAPSIGGGNGAGKAAAGGDEVSFDVEADAEEEQPMPRLVSEGALMGSGPKTPAPATAAPAVSEPRVTRSTAPAATAPTMAMAAVPADVEESRASAARDAGAPPQARASEPPKAKSSALSVIIIILVLGAIGFGVYYVKVMSDSAAKVSTQIAAPREIVKLYDGAAAAKKSDGQALTIGEGGKVADAVAAGAEVKAGQPLVTLDSYAKIEKELADVKDREGYYEKQLAAAKAKNDDEGAKTAQGKVDEKKKLLGELEARVAKVRLVAPGAATVAQVMVKAGDDVKAGDAAVKLADKHVTAEFALGGDAAALKPGQAVALQAAGGGATVSGRVANVAGDKVTVELADDAAVKPGDSLRLVKQKVSNVIPVPAAAVVKRDSGDVVYVLADGAVHERKVSVVDRNDKEALVGSGIVAGDQVVTSGGDALHDGQKAAP